ncbi:glucose 1-dehydrogenase [Sediminibacillus halophilus]|uniref:Glucose 1-dehydrogenase n=1 Tax=Sediminibacillus halophilus TaxID=482461 RepID=A0A1G9X5V6_9BACI|nr:glucose 1-dehydrogenase [Sediminibacillus halophilus]SDM92072.1 glucose 1-dehydrogenase [Sediminibacillus halophilus]
MYPDLAGKTAIVTGSSKGIGQGIAVRFGREKMNVVVDYHTDPNGAEETVRLIKEHGGNAMAVEADVSREEGMRQLIDAAIQRFGAIQVMVNNAGFSNGCPSHELSLQDWRRVLEVNLTGAFLGSREAIKYMLDHDINGSVINISSVHQQIPKVHNVHYSTTKGGMKMMTETLALEYAGRGIRVNAIAPGTIETPANPTEEKQGKEKEATLEKIPMNKIGKPEQIAAAAAWLVSEEAGYVTGTTLFVDGGMTLYPSQLG